MQQAQVSSKATKKQEETVLDTFANYLAILENGQRPTGRAANVLGGLPEPLPAAMNCVSDAAMCINTSDPKYETVTKMMNMLQARFGDRMSEIMEDPLVQKLLSLGVRNEKGNFVYGEDTYSGAASMLEKYAKDNKLLDESREIRKGAETVPRPNLGETVPKPAKPEEQVTEDAHVKDREIAATPEYIKQIDLMELLRQFEKDPSDFGLQKIFLKLRYLQTLRSSLSSSIDAEDIRKRDAISEEISKLDKWLKDRGFWQEGDNTEKGLLRIQNSFAAIQNMYYEMSNRNLKKEDKEQKEDEKQKAEHFLVDYLKQSEDRNLRAFGIFKGYLSSLDARAANLFEGIDPQDRKFVSKVKTRMDSFLASEDYKRAQGQWFEEYYKDFAPPEYGAGEQIESQAHAGLAELEPLIANSFARYLKAIKSSGLGSEEERKLVTGTAIKLYAVSPLLVLKYFDAIANIAEICEDNQGAFTDAMVALSARIATETDAITKASSPYQILPMNVRTIASRLANALEEISQIDAAAVSRYDRLNLWDETVYMDPNPPHEIRQKGPEYIPNPALGLPQPGTLGTPYPFTNQYFPSVSDVINAGNVSVNQLDYGGGLVLPNIRPLNISGQSAAQAMAMKSYIDPEHPFIAINEYLPGVNVSTLSASKLLMEISKAFIPTEMPEYSGDVVAGGAAAGVYGRKDDEWNVGGGALGSFITPTGGFAFGGSVVEDQKVLAGSAALAVPLGHADDFSTVAGIDNAFAGYEQDLPTNAKELLAHAVATQWDAENPSQHIITVSWTQEGNEVEGQEGKETLLSRYFYIEKDGTVYELMGGKNDFIDTLNFGALYANAPGGKENKPATFAANVEPRIDTGGTAVAVDLGNTAILGHIQQIPFWELAEEEGEERRPAPRLLQWTGAFAVNVEGEPEEGAAIHKVTLPGRMLTLKREGDEERTDGQVTDKYFMQDIVYDFRRVKGPEDAWEITVGVGLGQASVGESAETRPNKYMIGRGGFFIKVEDPKYSVGGGAYYESAGTRMDELAIMSEVEEARQYIESLHRLGMTVYGSRELADRLVIGALFQGIEQLREQRDALTGASSVEHDRFLARFVGLLIGARNAGRIDISRLTGMESILMEYDKLGKQVAGNSANASSLINEFNERYRDEVMQNFDRYSLGVQISRDFSMEFFLMTREEENNFASQTPDNIYGRMLATWGTEVGGEGFWRAFAAVPLRGQAGMPGNDVVGMMGTGIGQDMFNSVFLNRFAADFGMIAARVPAEESDWREWDMTAGWFAQGAVRLFSNMLEDSRDYRMLERNNVEYVDYVREGKYSKIPSNVREKIAAQLEKDPDKLVPAEEIARIREGKDHYDESGNNYLSGVQEKRVEDALWVGWFAPKKEQIQEEFNGHYRQYLGGSVYFIGEDVQWDIGMIAEYVDGLASVRAYVIAAQREQMGIYGGVDVGYGGLTAGGMFGATSTSHGVAASVGYTWEGPLDLPWNISIMGFSRSQDLPEYTIPLYRRTTDVGQPEFGTMLVLTIGAQGIPTLPMAAAGPEPGLAGTGGAGP